MVLSRPRRYTPIVEAAGRPATAAKESIAEANGAYDQVLAMPSGAKT
ncbi:hypothetical protein OG272_27040 [Streptomyces sp. NBC_00104]